MGLQARSPRCGWVRGRSVRCRRRGPLLALLATLAFIGGGEGRAQLAPVGVAKNAIGVLTVTRSNGGTERLQGEGALPLFEGDELRTGAGAQALIELSDGTQLALNEQTTVVMRPRRPGDKGIIRILKLLLGEIWVKTSHAPPPLEVETPVTTAAIRSTEFNLKVLPDGRSELTVIEGVVELGMPQPPLRGLRGPTPGAVCPVQAGTTSLAEGGKPCSPPVAVDVKRVTAWTSKVVR